MQDRVSNLCPPVPSTSRPSAKCDVMCASFSSATVRCSVYSMPPLCLMCLHCRGRRQKYYSHFTHQRVLCRPCKRPFSLLPCNSLIRTAIGATYSPRGDHSTRSHPRKRDNIHRRFWRRVVSDQLLSALLTHLTAGPHDRIHLESEIRKAHVICVVYSIDNPNSFDRIPTYWLPHFRQLGVNVSCFFSRVF